MHLTPVLALMNTPCKVSRYYSISLFIDTLCVLTRSANALMEARCIKQVNRFIDKIQVANMSNLVNSLTCVLKTPLVELSPRSVVTH